MREPVNLVDGPAAIERAEHRPHPAVGRNAQRLLQRRVVLVLVRPPGRFWPNSRPLLPSSSDRNAFRNDSLNVRPIAMASPTDFICVVSVRSACGNFSNAHRGTLTTT